MENLIAPETKYLIDSINYIMQKHNVPQYVDAVSSTNLNELKVELEVEFNYLLFQEDKEPVEIVSSKIRVDPGIYYANDEDILKDLNDRFFVEILLHTNFNTNITESDYRTLLSTQRHN